MSGFRKGLVVLLGASLLVGCGSTGKTHEEIEAEHIAEETAEREKSEATVVVSSSSHSSEKEGEKETEQAVEHVDDDAEKDAELESALIESLRSIEGAEQMEYDALLSIAVDDGSGAAAGGIATSMEYHTVCEEDAYNMNGTMEMAYFGDLREYPYECYGDATGGEMRMFDSTTGEWMVTEVENSNASMTLDVDGFDYLRLGDTDSEGRPVLLGEVQMARAFAGNDSSSISLQAMSIGIDTDELVAKVMMHFNPDTLELEQFEMLCDEYSNGQIRIYNYALSVKYDHINSTTSSDFGDVVEDATVVN